jgi:hypothetical protein
MPIDFEVKALLLLRRRDERQMIGNVSCTRNLCHFFANRRLLICGTDGSLQGNLPVTSYNFDVVSVCRERFVVHDSAPNLLGSLTIGRIHLLLISCGGTFIGITFIRFGIVGRRLLVLLDGTS